MGLIDWWRSHKNHPQVKVTPTSQSVSTKLFLFALILSLACACRDSNSTLQKGNIFNFDGAARTYDLFVPSDLGSSTSPLVILFHGATSNTNAMTGERRGKAPIADDEGGWGRGREGETKWRLSHLQL